MIVYVSPGRRPTVLVVALIAPRARGNLRYLIQLVKYVPITHLQLALGLRRSQHVRVMRDTTVMLRQAHALHARLAGTRVSLRMVSRIQCAMRVQRTRLHLALGLRRSQHVRVMRDTTAMLHQGHAVRARLAGTRVRRLRMVTRIQCAMRVQRTRLLLALGLRRSLIVRAV